MNRCHDKVACWDWIIDEVGVFNVALSENDIKVAVLVLRISVNQNQAQIFKTSDFTCFLLILKLNFA